MLLNNKKKIKLEICKQWLKNEDLEARTKNRIKN